MKPNLLTNEYGQGQLWGMERWQKVEPSVLKAIKYSDKLRIIYDVFCSSLNGWFRLLLQGHEYFDTSRWVILAEFKSCYIDLINKLAVDLMVPSTALASAFFM